MATNIRDLDKKQLLEKYKEILKYCCYNDDKLCNELSVSCNYICSKCIKNNKKKENIDINKIKENYINKENLIIETIKNYLTECETCKNKSPEEEIKVYRVKQCFGIYNVLYYNPIFNIGFPIFLIRNILKINQLINDEHIFFNKFVEANQEYKFIYKYMTNINNFCKEYENINKINLNFNIKVEDYNNFLEEYVKFISKEYENVINKQEDINVDIDINNLCQYSFVLDI
jgi:hypothetical protein